MLIFKIIAVVNLSPAAIRTHEDCFILLREGRGDTHKHIKVVNEYLFTSPINIGVSRVIVE
jgi:hypothetical protein